MPDPQPDQAQAPALSWDMLSQVDRAQRKDEWKQEGAIESTLSPLVSKDPIGRGLVEKQSEEEEAQARQDEIDDAKWDAEEAAIQAQYAHAGPRTPQTQAEWDKSDALDTQMQAQGMIDIPEGPAQNQIPLKQVGKAREILKRINQWGGMYSENAIDQYVINYAQKLKNSPRFIQGSQFSQFVDALKWAAKGLEYHPKYIPWKETDPRAKGTEQGRFEERMNERIDAHQPRDYARDVKHGFLRKGETFI